MASSDSSWRICPPKMRLAQHASSVGPNMAETSERTFFSCCYLTLTLLFFFFIENSESQSIENSVTFLGYLNDPTTKTFSALLEVEISTASEENGFSDDYLVSKSVVKKGQSSGQKSLWLATKDSKLCNDVYGVAKVDSESPNSAQCNEKFHINFCPLFRFFR